MTTSGLNSPLKATPVKPRRAGQQRALQALNAFVALPPGPGAVVRSVAELDPDGGRRPPEQVRLLAGHEQLSGAVEVEAGVGFVQIERLGRPHGDRRGGRRGGSTDFQEPVKERRL